MSAPLTARARVHAEVSHEILTVARAHLARDGGVALSLRSIARELGMAPSALYRYYDGRDALLSALIISAYAALADEGERASQTAVDQSPSDIEHFAAVARAMRSWALAHPHEWSLIFGTPVPGYQAPPDTVVHYARLASALFQPVAAAFAADRLVAEDLQLDDQQLVGPLGDAVAPVAETLFRHMPTVLTVRGLQAWSTVIGLISLEIFGHWRDTVLDPPVLFEQTAGDVARSLGLR